MKFVESIKTGISINLQSAGMLWRNKKLLLYFLSLSFLTYIIYHSIQFFKIPESLAYIVIPIFFLIGIILTILFISYHTAQISRGKTGSFKEVIYGFKPKIKNVLLVIPIFFIILALQFAICITIAMSLLTHAHPTFLMQLSVFFIIAIITIPFLFFPAIVVVENKSLLQIIKNFPQKIKSSFIEFATISFISLIALGITEKIPLSYHPYLKKLVTVFWLSAFSVIVTIFFMSITILYMRTEE